jgi:hypothetical protein
MTPLSLELVGEGTPRTFTQNEVRIGTSGECDFVLPAGEYPAVGLEHLRMSFDGAEWWAKDLSGASGTLLNGRRFSRHLLCPGDVLRLTNEGPELKVHFATGVQVAPTILVAGAAKAMPTRMTGRPPTRPGESTSTINGAQASTKQARSVATSKGLAAQPTHMSDLTQSSQKSETNLAISPPEEAMIEQKLNLLRNLLIGATIVILFSVALVLSQMQEISAIRRNLTDTRKELAEMRVEAHTALGKSYPELDTRFARLEKTLDDADQRMQQMGQGMDQKMQQLEDRFVRRMNKEIPVIIDQYLKEKQGVIRKHVQDQVIPAQ